MTVKFLLLQIVRTGQSSLPAGRSQSHTLFCPTQNQQNHSFDALARRTPHLNYAPFVKGIFVCIMESVDREVNHYVIFSICTSCIYCRHTKENRIQLSEYKDCNINGVIQPLQHTKNITLNIQYNVAEVLAIHRWIW